MSGAGGAYSSQQHRGRGTGCVLGWVRRTQLHTIAGLGCGLWRALVGKVPHANGTPGTGEGFNAQSRTPLSRSGGYKAPPAGITQMFR